MAWKGNAKSHVQRLRRYYLLGQTEDGMQAYDIRRAIAALRDTAFGKAPLWLQGEGAMGVNAVYASLFEHDIARIDVHQPPGSHMSGPTYLNVLKYLDTPQAVAMASANSKVRIYTKEKEAWNFVAETAKKLGRADAVQLRDADAAQ